MISKQILSISLCAALVLASNGITAGERAVGLNELQLRETGWSAFKRKYLWWSAAGVATTGAVAGAYLAHQKNKEEEEEQRRRRERERERNHDRQDQDRTHSSSARHHHGPTVVHNTYYGNTYYPGYRRPWFSWWAQPAPEINIQVNGNQRDRQRDRLEDLQVDPGMDRPYINPPNDSELIFRDWNDYNRDGFNLQNNPLRGNRFVACRKHPLNTAALFLVTNKGIGLMGLSPWFRDRRRISHVNLDGNKEFRSSDRISWDYDTEYLTVGDVEVAVDPPSSEEVTQRRKSKTFWRTVKTGAAATACLGGAAGLSYYLLHKK